MQDQLTSGQTSLQQQAGSGLQQNSSNLQQGGSPATSSNVFTTLSQNAPSTGLRVQSAQTDPSLKSQTYTPGASVTAWIVPFAFVLAVIMALVLWIRIRNQVLDVTQEVIEVPEPVATEKPKKAATKAKLTGKKATRRKRQAKR